MNTSESGRLASLVPEEGAATRHFILTHGRSGSNYLCNTLNLHPQVVNYGEVLGSWTLPHLLYRGLRVSGLGWAEYLDLLYGNRAMLLLAQAYSATSRVSRGKRPRFKPPGQLRSIGIKDFGFALRDRDLLDYFACRDHIRLLYLRRRNLLDRYLSLRAMQATGMVKTEQSAHRGPRLTIDIADMLKKLRIYRDEEAIAEALLSGVPAERVLRIDYDRMFAPATRPALFAAIWKHLGVRPVEVASAQRKILNARREELIANHAEVEAALRDSEFAAFLDGGG